MFDTRNDYYLNFCFYFWKRKSCTNFNHLPIRQEKRKEIYRNFAIFTVTVPLVLPTGTKDSEKFTKFRNIHSNSSTSPSHRHEGFGEIYKNFAIFTVTVPLVLPTGTKDSEKFTKISQYSQ